MPQDKRLIITKAVLYKLQRVAEEHKKDAVSEGIYIVFTLPTVVVAQCPELCTHLFPLPHPVFAKDGRTTCIIVPKVITSDCFKINKRHHHVDAVVTAESICRRGDGEAAQRAQRVAATFRHFLVDSRIVQKLPLAITERAKNGIPLCSSAQQSGSGSNSNSSTSPAVFITPVEGLDHTESLAVRLSQAASSGLVRRSPQAQGQLVFRVGHGGMTAGDICENAKCFIFALKRDYAMVWKYVYEFKMASRYTDDIRFMEVQIHK